MSATKSQDVFQILEALLKFLKPSEIVKKGDAEYSNHTLAFAAQYDLQPTIVLVPENTDSLRQITQFLYKSKLDFSIRGHGLKSPPAQDIIVSMVNFKGFSYDNEKKLATIGAGMTWLDVQEQMHSTAPDYAIVSARVAAVGVAGSIQLGGVSWMSSEFGWMSDPINFVDAEVVKYDGTVVNASEEPDLLFALRGGGAGFGIVSKVTLRAFPYSQKIYNGNIIVPRHSLPELARGIANFVATNPPNSRVSALLIILKGPIFILQVYDAYGAEHGREVFKFALDIPGAHEDTRESDSLGTMELQKNATQGRGQLNVYSATFGLPDVDYDLVTRAVNWVDSLQEHGGSISDDSKLIFQLFAIRPHVDASPDDCAWPRTSELKHMILLTTSCKPTAPAKEAELAQQLAIDAPARVLGKDARVHMAPIGLESYHDPRLTYGSHWKKLVDLRSKYDPEKRFKGLVGHEY